MTYISALIYSIMKVYPTNLYEENVRPYTPHGASSQLRPYVTCLIDDFGTSSLA